MNDFKYSTDISDATIKYLRHYDKTRDEISRTFLLFTIYHLKNKNALRATKHSKHCGKGNTESISQSIL